MLIFLGIPLVAGYLTRRIGVRTKGRDWYESTFIPRIGPFALYGLLFTIVVMFALQGEAITSDPFAVLSIAVPLLVYFAIMWSVSFLAGTRARLGYPRPRPSRSPQPATTSSSRSRSASVSGASRRGRRSPV